MKMFRITTMMALVCGWSVLGTAQTPNPKVEKIMEKVDECNYEVVLGLAEIVSVEKIVDAADSPLAYDEYDVKFVFHRMEGNELLPSLNGQELPFYLKYKNYDLRVGPDYIKSYQVRKGLKFSMKMLQNRDGTCAQKYVYDSRGIPNDLFEARPNLLEFEKDFYVQEARKKEGAIAQDEFYNTTSPNMEEEVTTPVDIETPVTNPVVQPPTPTTTPTETEEPKDNKPVEESTPTETTPAPTTTEIDRDKIREELEAEIAAELAKEEAEIRRKEQERIEQEQKDAAAAAAEAERIRQEQEQKDKEAADAAAAAEAERLAEQEAEVRDQMRAEIEAEMRAEMEAKLAKEEEEKAEEERLRQEAIARDNAIREASEKEGQRAQCEYNTKISGTIKVISVRETLDEKESLFGYQEHEVYVKFIPDNMSDFSKKEKKAWDETYLFVLDAKGKSANPSAAYIRKYSVSSGTSYKGFAQQLSDGICNEILFFSPDLPADAAQITVE